jgi:hypothetical protein
LLKLCTILAACYVLAAVILMGDTLRPLVQSIYKISSVGIGREAIKAVVIKNPFSATDRQRRNDAYFALVVVIVIPSVFLLGLTAFVWRRNARRKAEQECAEGRRHQQPGNRTVDPSKEDKKWWNVLQVSRDANASDIRRSYLRIIQQYHPDRLAGLAPELVELAERRSKTLNAAYAEALHMRGEA